MDDNTAMVEKTPGLVRFRLALEAKTEKTFTVIERRPAGTRISLGDLTDARIVQLVQRGTPDAEFRHALEPIVAKREEISSLESQLASLTASANEVRSDEQRLRENMQALGTTRDERALRQRYAKSLEAAEERLLALQADAKRASTDLDGKHSELSHLIATISFDLSGE
jgi:DNA repair exonuclease SbcCD ATPase subunit